MGAETFSDEIWK